MSNIPVVSAGQTPEGAFLDQFENSQYQKHMKSHVPESSDWAMNLAIRGLGAVGGLAVGGFVSAIAASLITNPNPGMLLQNPIAVGIVAVGASVAAVAGAYLMGQELKEDQQNKTQVEDQAASMDQAALKMPALSNQIEARREAAASRAAQEIEQARLKGQRGSAMAIGLGAFIGK